MFAQIEYFLARFSNEGFARYLDVFIIYIDQCFVLFYLQK